METCNHFQSFTLVEGNQNVEDQRKVILQQQYEKLSQINQQLYLAGSKINLPSIKQVEISFRLIPNASIQSINMLNRQQNQTQSTKNGLKVINKQKLQIQKIQINQQKDQKLNHNLFIGSNPGIFCTNKSQFQKKDQQKSLQFKNLVSIQKIPLLPSTQQFKVQQSQQSMDTIIDQDTLELEPYQTQQNQKFIQLSHNKINLQQNSNKKFLKTNITSKTYVNRHSKHCTDRDNNKNDKNFIVPILIDKYRHNKSKYSSKEYRPTNDEHLINFFVTKNKKKYVEEFIDEKTNHQKFVDMKRQDIHKQKYLQNEKLQVQVFKQRLLSANCHVKTLGKNRISTCSNPNVKGIHFQDINEIKFQKTTSSNTKFLVKIIPSQKTRKFFNQSTSTLINHNYCPLTSRKNSEEIKNRNILASTKHSNFSSNIFKATNNDKGEKKDQIQMISSNIQKFQCDYWAQMNSYRRMNYNSKKNKKIKSQKTQNKLLINNIQEKCSQNKQKKTENKQNEQKLEDLKLLDSFKSSQFNKNSLNTWKQNSKGVQTPLSKVQEAVQLQSVNNNSNPQLHIDTTGNINTNTTSKHPHLKRVNRLQRQVMSKLGIVTRMGVKVPYVTCSNTNIKQEDGQREVEHKQGRHEGMQQQQVLHQPQPQPHQQQKQRIDDKSERRGIRQKKGNKQLKEKVRKMIR